MTKVQDLWLQRDKITNLEDQIETKMKEIKARQKKILETYPDFVDLVEQHNQLSKSWNKSITEMSKSICEFIDTGEIKNEQ